MNIKITIKNAPNPTLPAPNDSGALHLGAFNNLLIIANKMVSPKNLKPKKKVISIGSSHFCSEPHSEYKGSTGNSFVLIRITITHKIEKINHLYQDIILLSYYLKMCLL